MPSAVRNSVENGFKYFKGISEKFDPIEKYASLLVKTAPFVEMLGHSTAGIAPFVEACKAVPTINNLLKLPGTISFFVLGEYKKPEVHWSRIAMNVDLIFVDILSGAESLIKLKLLDPARFTNVISKIPVVGAQVASLSIGVVIQPFLMLLATFSIIDNSVKLAETIPAKQARMNHKITLWQSARASAVAAAAAAALPAGVPATVVDPVARDPLAVSGDSDEGESAGADFDLPPVQPIPAAPAVTAPFIYASRSAAKTARADHASYVSAKTAAFNTLTPAAQDAYMARKVTKWEQKEAQTQSEVNKAWIAIATDVVKLVGAIATFALLCGATAVSLPAVVTTLAVAGAAFTAIKASYTLYVAVTQKPIQAVRIA